MAVAFPAGCLQDLIDQPNINGSLLDWSAGTTFSTAVGLAINWKCTTLGTGGSPAATMSQQTFTLGSEAPVPGNPLYFLRIAQTALASTTGLNVIHQIEDVTTFNGMKVTAEFWYRADQPWTLQMVQNFGTGGSPTATVTTGPATNSPAIAAIQPALPISTVGNDPALSPGIGASGPTTQNGWTLARFQFNLPAIPVGAVLGSNVNTGYLGLQFTGPLNVTTTLDIAQCRIYAGWDQMEISRRRPAQQELLLTKRYYQTYAAYAPVSTQSAAFVGFPVPMRAAPAMSGGAGSTLANPTAAGHSIISTGAAAQITGIIADARL